MGDATLKSPERTRSERSTVRFWLRTDKVNKKGKAPIVVVYQFRGGRRYYPTSESIPPANWDIDNQKVIYKDPKKLKKEAPELSSTFYLTTFEIDEINNKLTQIRVMIAKIESSFQLNKQSFDVQKVVDKLKLMMKDESLLHELPQSKVFFDFLDSFIANNPETKQDGSLSVYRSLRSRLWTYSKETRTDVFFENIDYTFFINFNDYLVKRTDLFNITIAKQLSTFKTLLHKAERQGFPVNQGYKLYEVKRDKIEDVTTLTREEFLRLYKMDLTQNKTFDKVRDIFCFSCATGLRYSDMENLEWVDIKWEKTAWDLKAGGWIDIKMIKTKRSVIIPLNEYSFSILKKYSDRVAPLPMMSNQKLNQYLKGWDDKDENGKVIKHNPGLCEIAGIDKPIKIVRSKGKKRHEITYPKYELIGVHAGRKSFCTLGLEFGMTAEEVMAISGHTDYKSFQRYVNVTPERSKVVMAKAWGSIESNKLEAI